MNEPVQQQPASSFPPVGVRVEHGYRHYQISKMVEDKPVSEPLDLPQLSWFDRFLGCVVCIIGPYTLTPLEQNRYRCEIWRRGRMAVASRWQTTGLGSYNDALELMERRTQGDRAARLVKSTERAQRDQQAQERRMLAEKPKPPRAKKLAAPVSSARLLRSERKTSRRV